MQKISYSCIDPIWKLEILDESTIVAEIRNEKNFTTSWKIFDVTKEHCLKSFDNIENSWWKSIVYANKNYIIFHELRQGKNPEINSTEIYYIDSEKIDRFESFQFIGLFNQKIHLRNKRGEEHSIESEDKRSNTLTEPIIYKESSAYFSDFEAIIINETGCKPTLECEYAEFQEHILLGYYTKNEFDTYSSHILILNQKGKNVYQNRTYKDLKGVIFGIFFVHSNKVIFTNSNNEINILTI